MSLFNYNIKENTNWCINDFKDETNFTPLYQFEIYWTSCKV